jgi:hypothetical protein
MYVPLWGCISACRILDCRLVPTAFFLIVSVRKCLKVSDSRAGLRS